MQILALGAIRLSFMTWMTVACISCAPGHEELPSYSYRLTVELQTPEGPRSGSSVIEVRTWQADRGAIEGSGSIRNRVIGEAVIIDMGKRGRAFALLRAGNYLDWPGGVARSLLPPFKGDEFVVRRAEITAVKALGGVRDVPPTFASGSARLQNWPDLIRFEDPQRPETARWLGPMPPGRTTSAEIAIRRVTIEIVASTVSRGIGRVLTWLESADAERRLPVSLDRQSLDPFIPPLSYFDFTRSADR